MMGAVSAAEGTPVEVEDRYVSALFADLYPQLVRAVAAYVPSVAVAEDIAQEAMLRAWQRRDRLAGVEDVSSWVFRVAINLSRSWRRRAQLELRHLPTVVGHRADPADEGGDRAAVMAALRKLPGRQRAAVALRYFADLSVEDTAKVMGCAPGTVKALTHQALAAMRIRLREEPDDGE